MWFLNTPAGQVVLPAPVAINSSTPFNGTFLASQAVNGNAGDGEGSGSMSITDGTIDSINVVFAQLGLDVGPDNIAKTAYKLGVVTLILARVDARRSDDGGSRADELRSLAEHPPALQSSVARLEADGWTSGESRCRGR